MRDPAGEAICRTGAELVDLGPRSNRVAFPEFPAQFDGEEDESEGKYPLLY